MTDSSQQPCGVHLVGSISLENNTAVFQATGSILGQHLCRIPDGETGERSHWIRWQKAVLTAVPQLEVIKGEEDKYGNAPEHFKLRDGCSGNDVEFGTLGYSKAAIASYAEFKRQREAGTIPANCKFQVSLPTPLAPIQFYVAPQDRAAIEPSYEAKLLEELQQIVEAIPAQDLAIQWDTAAEFGVIEGVFPSYLDNPKQDILDRLVRLGNAVPAGVELGYHLCYGDSGHKHFVDPKDTAILAEVANAIAAGVTRPLNWIHLPVPIDRDDEGYYLPLKGLQLHPETELYLGLVHIVDGVEGTQRRIQAAQKVVEKFGVATECGFGRRPAESIPGLMELHAAVSHPRA